MTLIPCKNLDHEPKNYPSCELTELESFCGVKYFFRKGAAAHGNPEKVQFCKKGQHRINSVFDCYEHGYKNCYEPEEP